MLTQIQGQKVSVTEGVKQHYSLKVPLGKENQPWVTQVVMSTLPAAELPSSLNQPGASRLCKVESILPADMKVKSRRWFDRRSHFLKAEFDVQVIIGAADLKFRTLGRDGILSQAHDTIAVQWFSSPASSKTAQVVVSEPGADGLDRYVRPESKTRSRTSEFLLKRFNAGQ